MDYNGDPDVRRRSPAIQTDATSSSEVTNETTVLKRQVGLISGVAFLAGSMIGSGIFISPKGVMQQTGSVGLSLTVWTGCGVLSMMGSLCYAELGTLIRQSGGEYAYLMKAFGPIVAYMFSWTSILVIRTSAVAIICLAFAGYVFDPMFDDCGPPDALRKLLGAVAILAVTLINCFSVRLAARTQTLFTVIKLSALAMIIVGGLVKLCQGQTQYLENSFEDTTDNPSKVALAFYAGLWAYDGWNNLNFVTEEIKNPKRNLPLAIGIAIPLVTVVYVLTNISYLTVMSKTELLASPAVAALWGERVLGRAWLIIPISVACSTFGAANGIAFSAGRLTYVSAREGHLPDVMSYVNVNHYTPLTSLVVNMVISLLMIIPGDIGTLINFFSFSTWIFYGATTSALLYLRYTARHAERPFKVPIAIPILFLLASIYLVIGPIVDEPQLEFLFATLFIVGGLIFYFPFVHFKLRIPGMDSLTMYVQLLAQVSPSVVDVDAL